MDNGKPQYNQIQNISILKIAKIICAFLNSADDDESYIFFGVLDDRSKKCINEDINYYKKEEENEHVTNTYRTKEASCPIQCANTHYEQLCPGNDVLRLVEPLCGIPFRKLCEVGPHGANV